MAKLTGLLMLALLMSVSSIAQTSTLTGTVGDPTEKRQVQNAVVALLTTSDSVLYKFTRSDAEGKFAFKDLKPGKYILMTTHPYFADVLDNITVTDGTNDIGALVLTSKSKLLMEVIVKSGSPIKIKGDTTVYTADSFKVSANANVEELLKKLPGIQVDKNGQIKAMGEVVEKVLVDGEEFFGDDPGMAVKNLRADAVKEVQVFDKKSDQAEFTGVDDGKTQKTINLKLKEDKKTGYFGKIDVAGGTQKNIDHRYNDNILFSSFKGKRKFSAFLLNGNTGQDGLSWQDEQKYGGQDDNVAMSIDEDGGMMYMWRGGTSDDEPYFNPQNGFITNVNAGIQYSNKWSDKQTLNLSPKFNSQLYDNTKQTFIRTQVGDIILNDRAIANTHINRHNFKIRGTYDIKLDSMNTIKLTANANFYHTESDEERMSVSTGNLDTLKNTSERFLKTNSDKAAYSGNIIFKHKFKKTKRTLSVSADWKTLHTEGINYLESFNQAYSKGLPAGSQQLNQMKDNDKTTSTLSSKFVYTEPIGKKYAVEIAYQLVYNFGTNDQLTYNYSPSSGKHDELVDSLSNRFRQNILQQIPSAKLNYSYKKFKVNIGSGIGFTNFKLKDLSYNKDYDRTFTNFFPAATLNYTYKANHSLRLNYSGNTKQPTIDQLQPLRNNNDYFNQYIGNPGLKPSFSNSFNLSHNSYNFIKDMWTYQSINIRLENNSITNNRIINIDSNKTTTQPINTNGNLSIGMWTGFGFKSKKLDTRFNINPNINYNKYADVINSKTSFSKTLSTGISFWIYKSKDKKYDLSLGSDFSRNRNKTSQSSTVIAYNTNTLSLDATVYIKKVWSINTEYQVYSRQKTFEGDNNLNNQLWNASLQRTFKNNEFTAYIRVKDILNQNIGVDRSFYSNTYKEERNDRLKRYFLVGFTWDFKNKSTQPSK